MISLRHRQLRRSASCLGAVLLLAVILPSLNPAMAATFTWDGSGSGSNLNDWSAKQNWGNSGPPGSGDTATFTSVVGNSSTPTLSVNAAINTINFNAGAAAFNISGAGRTLTINGGGINDSATNTETFSVSTIALGASQTWSAASGALSFTGSSITLGSNTLTVSGGSNTSISNVISGSGGSLTKSGGGTLTLTGQNTYGTSGTTGTQVNAGTLLVNNTAGSGTGVGNVKVNGNGTTLGGTGTISGTVELGNTTTSAVLNPGANSTTAGTLTTGALTLTGSNTFHIDAFGTLQSQWDQLGVNGTVTLGTTSLLQVSIASGLNFTGGSQYTLINNDLIDMISGTFTNAAQGSTVNFSGYNFTVSYTGGTGNDLVLTAVPEPSTWVAAALTLGAIGFSQRRRIACVFKRAS